MVEIEFGHADLAPLSPGLDNWNDHDISKS
jgi:hypothetical protein